MSNHVRKKIEAHAKKELKGELAAGYDHFKRVYSTARQLSGADVDDDVLHAACFLHDIVQEEPHNTKSAEAAEAFLKDIGFPAGKIPAVKDAIINHIPNGRPRTAEGVLLRDADIMDFLGAVGVVRLSIAGWDWFGAKTMAEVADIMEKYSTLKNKLSLLNSRRMLKNKMVIMDMFIEQLKTELADAGSRG